MGRTLGLLELEELGSAVEDVLEDHVDLVPDGPLNPASRDRALADES